MNSRKEPQKTRAAALEYEEGKHSAPCIMGLGEGYVAKKMLETAEKNRIPVVEDQSLVDVLNQLSVGDEIPEELYHVIAQVLVFISRLDNVTAGRYKLEDIKKERRR